MIKIIIADDHQVVIDGLKLMLSLASDLECIAEAYNGEQLIDVLKNLKPDIILLDIDMPVINGIEACKVIHRNDPDVKILALSMLKEASMIKLMLKNGAQGYLLKNAGQDEVIEAIRKVHAGEKFFSKEVSEIIMQSLSGVRNKKKTSPFPQLSRREKQVLQLIVDEYTTQEIATKLFISFGTVETHRRNMLIKLGAKNTAGLVRIGLEYGLLGD